jgi:excisionase family DNA binding protein
MTEVAPAISMPKLYSTKEVAELFSVTAETVRTWIATGRLKGTQIGGHQYRVTRADLIAFAKSHYGVDL